MRPVLLEMEGFASFRERALVDFEDADYFAIVGPTGAGKSTIVDALTFALFGSAPRWGRKNAVSMALSPHGNRAVVRLVFELAGQRYVVAREVRRTGQSTTAKNQRLERLPSVTSRGEPDEITESLAADSKVTEAVEKLLGLTFEQFRQCVVLPQNAFAEFLHSTPKDRQEILLRLIGAEHYEVVRGEANQRAQAARDRVEHLDRTLADLGDATPEAEAAAAAREQTLAGLVTRVRAALPGLAAAQEALAGAQAVEQRLGAERDRLTAIVVPAGVSEIDRAVSEASSAASAAASGESAAETADTAAREQLSAAPARGPLEQTVKNHTELARLTAERPGLVSSESSARAAHEAAGHQVTQAELRFTQAQVAAERAGREADEATRRVAELEGQHRALGAPALPAGLDELDRDLGAARAARDAALAVLAEAEKADEAAASALEAGPPRGPLERARATLEDLEVLAGQLAGLPERAESARSETRAATAAVEDCEAALREAQARREEARVQHAASALRRHLVAGEPCPVCVQPVATLPEPGPDQALPGTGEAERALESARARLNQVARQESSAQAQLEAAERRREELRTNVPRACPDLATAERLLTELGALETRRREAGLAMRQARAAAEAARRTADDLVASETRIRSALGQARDPLVVLGAPPIEDLSLAEAWHRLIGWASEQAGSVGAELAQAREVLARVTAARQAAGAELATAGKELRQARAVQAEALSAAERVRERVAQAIEHEAGLKAALAGALSLDVATAQIRQIDGFEAAVRAADESLRVARQSRERAQQKLHELDGQLAAGWAGLRRTRDEVVPLGAPELTSDGLLQAWNGLVAWSSGAAAERAEQLGTARASTRTLRDEAGAKATELAGVLQQHEIPLPAEDLATTALAAATGAHAQARAARERVQERRAQAAGVLEERAAEEGHAHVAKMLGDLLRADKFPRWLATAALESLVLEASDTLLRLSNGQFDLSHDDKGDLVVVDHTDADARRSVKTLSGGETFQASLAMALALSSQMSQLSSAGGARLDSIFLDEGFGTLDPDTLETVAGTLENLARGERMVGVITHVPALADRVPVRFKRPADAQTSRVERQNL